MALPFLIFTPIWGITFLAIIRLINKNEIPEDAGVNNLATGRIIIGALLGGLEGGALAYLDYSKITFLSFLILGFGSGIGVGLIDSLLGPDNGDTLQ